MRLNELPGVWHARRATRVVGDAIRRRAPRGLVLLYHRIAGPRRDPQRLDVSPAHFGAQLALLARTTVPLALADFERRRRAGTLPPRAVALTFDDGYADNLHAAAPLLATHGMPATVFVTAGMVESGREFWWDDAERIAFLGTGSGPTVPGLALAWGAGADDAGGDDWSLEDTIDPTPRHQLYRVLCTTLKGLPAAARDARLDALRVWAGLPAMARDSHRMLTRRELQTLAGMPGITIGAHTMTHPTLASLSWSEQYRELRDSRAWLEDTLRIPVRSAAYPFGTGEDISRATERVARKAGYDYAMANEPGTAWRRSRGWRLPRVLVRDWDASTLAARLDQWFAA